MTGGTEKERFLWEILDTIEDPIMIVSRDYQILYVNKAAAARVGGQSEALIGQKCYKVFDKADAPPAFCPAARTLGCGERACIVRECGHPIDGPVFEEVSTVPFREDGGPAHQFMERIRDVSKEKKLERTLIASERLVVLGELAAGIAHEVNNPLGIILGFAQDLLTETKQDEPGHQSLRIIEEEAKRCSRVVRSLLDFARPMAPHSASTDVPTLLRRSIGLIASAAKKKRVAVIQQIPDGLPKLSLDAEQIHQVLINLFLNAMDAMPDGGTLSVSLMTVTAAPSSQPDGVEITVADTGHGISYDDIPKLFLPFFTRKPNGIGLGLSISKQIIEAHQGTLSVSGVDGQGAIFTIRLPVDQRAEGRGGTA